MAWWNNDWDYRLRVKVNSDYVDSNLTDVPLWVRLRDGNFDFSRTTTSGGDEIRFVDYNNTQIPHEITQWNTASGIGDIWVKFPSISSTEDSYVWMYYGNSTASGVPPVEVSSNVENDEFPGTTLSGIWTWDAGTGGSYTVSSSNLRISSGSGDIWAALYDPTWVYQSAGTGDFDVSTKLYSADITANYRQAGILVVVDSSNFWKLVKVNNGGELVSFGNTIGATAGSTYATDISYTADTVYLRVKRVDNAVYGYYKANEEDDWILIAHPVNKLYSSSAVTIGLVAVHPSSSQFTADFDWFRKTHVDYSTTVWDDYELVYHLNDETLDGTAGQVHDSSPVSNNGTSTGHPTPGYTGVVSTCPLFDGSDYITSVGAANAVGADDRTTMLWFKPTVANQGQWAGMFTYGASSTNAGWFMESATNNEDYYAFLLYGAAADTPTWIAVDPSEGWNHWALSWDSTDWKGFYNGNIITNRSASPNTTASTYLIGRNWDIPTNCIGYLDEVRVAIKAIDDDEIKVQYLNMGEHSKIMAYDEPDYEGLYPQWLGTWDQRIKLTIDHTKIDEPLEDFPMLVTLASGVGLNGADVTAVFDELNYPFDPDDDFTGTNGYPPDPTKWLDGGGAGGGVIQNNKLRFSVGSGSSEAYQYYCTYKLIGDFDIQMDYDFILGPSTNAWFFSLSVGTDEASWTDKDRAVFYRAYYSSGHKLIFQSYDGATYRDEFTIAESSTSGKMRITRVGSSWTCYYDVGGGWVSMGTSVYLTKTGPVFGRIRLENYTPGYPAVTVDVDNFIVNNGTVIWGNEEGYVSSFPNRKKIAITTWNGTQECYAEVQRWEQHNEQAWLWTKVPHISNVEDTVLYLYYDSSQPDNDNYVGDTTDIAARRVWDSNFVMVHHMERWPTTNQYDSTQNATNTTASNNFEDTDQVNGLIGKAISGDGVDESFDLPTTGILEVSPYTLEVILQKDTQGSSTSVLCYTPQHAHGDGRGWLIKVNSGGLVYTVKGSGDGGWESVTATTVVTNGEYHYVAVRFEVDTLYDILINGVIEDSETDPGELVDVTYVDGVGTNPPAKVAKIYSEVVAGPTEQGFMDGKIDEIRVSDTVRSVSWVRATNYTTRDSLISYGASENTEVFRFQGTVLVEGSPAARKVYLYRRDTGELVREVTSNEIDGLFEAGSPNWDYHFFVILPELTETFDLISHDKIHPGN